MEQQIKVPVTTAFIGGAFSILTACIAGVFLLLSATVPEMIRGTTSTPVPQSLVPQSVATQVVSLQNETSGLRQDLDALNQALAANPSADRVQLQEDIDSLQNRLSALEQVLLDNPSKALELALLRSDLDNLEAEIDFTRSEIDRAYKFSQVLLSMIFILATGISSFVVSGFLKERKRLIKPVSDEDNSKK